MEQAVAKAFEFHPRLRIARGYIETTPPTLSTGIVALDAQLPDGGLPLGRMTELTGQRAAGKLSLALLMLARSLGRGEPAALLDPDATAAPDLWLEPTLERLLVVRGGGTLAALRAADALLQTGVFTLIVLDLPGRATVTIGSDPTRKRSLTTSAFARLAQAARRTSTALVLVSEWLPWRPDGLASLVDLRLEVHKVDRDRADQDRADQDRADQDRADQDRADQDRADRRALSQSLQFSITKSKRRGNGSSFQLDSTAFEGRP